MTWSSKADARPIGRETPRAPTTRLIPVLLAAALVGGFTVASGCADRDGRERVQTLATLDSVLVELGRTAPADLTRHQRWRMVSSIWAGLPPTNFDPGQLPEPDSRSAGLLQAYCTQCHWIPAPQMHSAEEWPLLVRRMVLRAQTLDEHLGGPVTRRLVGDERMLSGMAITAIPSRAERDSLITYLVEHALPTAEPGDLAQAPGRGTFVEVCTSCHDTPSPAAHPPEEWAGVVERMQANMRLIGVDTMARAERREIVSYLEAVGGAGS